MIVQHNILIDPQTPTRFTGFSHPTCSEHPSALVIVAGITVGDGHKLDVVPHLCKQSRCPPEPYIRIIGMRTNGDDSQSTILLCLNPLNLEGQQKQWQKPTE